MIRGFLAVLGLSAALLAGAADGVRPTRVDFSSRPEGADVVVDGTLRGRTPLTLHDLAPGEHHVRFELRNYEGKDEFIQVVAESYSIYSADLMPVKGLLLVTSEPDGCNVSLNGLSLGETPRLITTLDIAEAHRLVLRKPGYQDRTVEVKFNGRTPLVRHEKLILDSGILEIKSEPAGAAVSVNGIPRGHTPVLVRDIPKGHATVSLKKEGYVEVVRELALNAGDSQTLFLKLEGIPGEIRLSSVPAGARFYLDGDPRGKGPVNIGNLSPGSYVVRAELEGYGTAEKTLTVRHGESISEEFRLENVLGRLEIRTKPADAQIFVDGHSCGVTRASNPNAEASDVMIVPDLPAGEHTVVVKRRGFAEVVRHPVLEASRATTLDIRLKRVFTPDIEIETTTGTYRGVLVQNGAESLLIEVSMGVTRSFPRADIRKINVLDGDQ